MPILKAYVFPHGSNILDPENFPAYPACKKLQLASIEAAKDLSSENPDLIFLITPHGHALSKSHCIYLNSKGSGNVDDSKEYSGYTSSFQIDNEISKKLLDFINFRDKTIPIEGITSYGIDINVPLKWAEVIPTWFINSALHEKNDPKFIVLSIADRRKTEGDKMVDECAILGELIYEFLNKLPMKIILVNSCDLAHTHKINGGPEAGTEPYGIAPEAEPFDELIEKWAKNTEKIEYLVNDAKIILMKALSCGYLGLVILANIFRKHGKTQSEVLAREHPTYFGMMIAIFKLL